MTGTKERIINVPNALSAYRIVAIPFIIYAIATGHRQLFIILISVNLITDILDGVIARMFKLQTEFGARLDSVADMCTFLMAITGFAVLDRQFVTDHSNALILLMTGYAVPYIISLARFRKTQSLHLYSAKVTGYVQGIFIFTFFNFGYAAWYFYFMIVVSLLSYAEEAIAVSIVSTLKSDIKSVFLLKKNG